MVVNQPPDQVAFGDGAGAIDDAGHQRHDRGAACRCRAREREAGDLGALIVVASGAGRLVGRRERQKR